MKKLIMILVAIMMVGCSTVPKKPTYITVMDVQKVQESDSLTVIVENYSKTMLKIRLKNTTSDVIIVDPNSSSIGSSSIALTSYKISSKDALKPNIIIPPMTSVVHDVYPVNNLYWQDGYDFFGTWIPGTWKLRNMYFPVTITLKTESKGKESFDVSKVVLRTKFLNEPKEEPKKEVVIEKRVNVKKLSLREKGNKNAELIRYLKLDEVVTIVSEGEWSCVRAGSDFGWVYSKFISDIKEAK